MANPKSIPIPPSSSTHEFTAALDPIAPSLATLIIAETGPIAFATSLDPCAKAIAEAVTIIRIAKADSTPYSLIFLALKFKRMAVIIETATPKPIVTIRTSLSVSGIPTCFNPFLAVTKPIITATKKL